MLTLPKGGRLAAVSLFRRQARPPDRRIFVRGPGFLRGLSKGANDKIGKNARARLDRRQSASMRGLRPVVDPSVYMQSIKIMIDDPDTDIVIIDSELPKAPHELRET